MKENEGERTKNQSTNLKRKERTVMLSDVFIKHVREIVLALLDDWFIQQGVIKTRRQGITVRDMR